MAGMCDNAPSTHELVVTPPTLRRTGEFMESVENMGVMHAKDAKELV